MNIRHAAVPVLILAGGALLAACGDTTADGGATPGTDLDATVAPLESTMSPLESTTGTDG
ncbi:hypothetical protein [Demequina aurantiaca]|uniref:hypothetical protein n=1 Tax=Demequina aurantiaca TaxID=676200 RepID=UPI003D338BD4